MTRALKACCSTCILIYATMRDPCSALRAQRSPPCHTAISAHTRPALHCARAPRTSLCLCPSPACDHPGGAAGHRVRRAAAGCAGVCLSGGRGRAGRQVAGGRGRLPQRHQRRQRVDRQRALPRGSRLSRTGRAGTTLWAGRTSLPCMKRSARAEPGPCRTGSGQSYACSATPDAPSVYIFILTCRFVIVRMNAWAKHVLICVLACIATLA